MAINKEPNVKTMNESVAVTMACSIACAPGTPKPKNVHWSLASSQWSALVVAMAKGMATIGIVQSEDLRRLRVRYHKLQYIWMNPPSAERRRRHLYWNIALKTSQLLLTVDLRGGVNCNNNHLLRL
jgi:hypothetical protein